MLKLHPFELFGFVSSIVAITVSCIQNSNLFYFYSFIPLFLFELVPVVKFQKFTCLLIDSRNRFECAGVTDFLYDECLLLTLGS